MKKVTIVCDGSSLGNGKKVQRAAACALLGFKGYWKGVCKYLGSATNQQSEIAAAEIGLKNLKEPCEVHLLSDSRYVVQTMLGNFKKKTNHEWWSRLDKAAAPHDITWEWTKGHAGHEIQEVADDLARKTAELGYVDEALIDEMVADLGTVEVES
ncbi:MAG: ribonuclease HI [Acidobacteria bacterium]|nr:MAG: ribonuclease HI [Acidobacteriota bacterium]REK04059.1 MAG: ribonuclease HI [Acidobacteriota bacterium]REK15221.1 MAG: ribonuclease HI [Acidobacteriota bacterium]REK46311.1 MAG: ribonuclease HI [Acidobacteriota bacterium]